MFALQKYTPLQGTRLLFYHFVHRSFMHRSMARLADERKKQPIFLQKEHCVYYLCVYKQTRNKQLYKMKGNGSITEIFFSLIRCGIGKGDSLPQSPTPQQWQELFEMAKKQTLAGIAFAGVEALPSEQRPPKEIILQWYTLCESIRKKNAELDRKCAAVSQKFKSEGFDNCILKGQGIAQLYPTPALRTPGDIDIWLGGGDEKVIGYVKKFIPQCKPTYHHVDFPIAPGLEIEVHYRPSWMCNPFTNRKFQKFFAKCANEQFANVIETRGGAFPAPTPLFNRIYILQHIFRHLFFEGIGMRQVLDYYFVMLQPMSNEEKREYQETVKNLGLYKFATAVCYVMQRIFAIDNEHCIVEPNAKEGEFLLKEILAAGNFGKYDTRYNSTSRGMNIAHISNLVRRTFTILAHYPGEMLWDPLFRVWHLVWRTRRKGTA